MTDTVIVRRVGANEASACVNALADVLVDCVAGGASVSFMWPLSHDKAQAFWRNVAEGVARNERALLIAEDADGAVLGTVQLVLAQPENQPHRADVAKMLVHRRARRRGIAQQLMAALDDIARAEGKTVLVLDTVTVHPRRLAPRGRGAQLCLDARRRALRDDVLLQGIERRRLTRQIVSVPRPTSITRPPTWMVPSASTCSVR